MSKATSRLFFIILKYINIIDLNVSLTKIELFTKCVITASKNFYNSIRIVRTCTNNTTNPTHKNLISSDIGLEENNV